MAQKTVIEKDRLKKARALADECKRTMFCDDGQSKLSDALQVVNAELSAVERQRDELLNDLENKTALAEYFMISLDPSKAKAPGDVISYSRQLIAKIKGGVRNE